MSLPARYRHYWPAFVEEEQMMSPKRVSLLGLALMFNLRHAPFETQLAAIQLLHNGEVTLVQHHNAFVTAFQKIARGGWQFRMRIPSLVKCHTPTRKAA